MKADQKFTPKYWVLHNKVEDDIYIDTASKSWDKTCGIADQLFGRVWNSDENLEIVLIEVRMVVQ